MQTDVHYREVPTRLDKHTIAQLSQLKAWRGMLQMAFEWLIVAVAIAACTHVSQRYGMFSLPWVAVYLASAICIGTRQHALGVLLHDAVHFRLSKNRKLNELAGEWLLAWPLSVSLHGYRRQHFAHHRLVGEADDPDHIRVRNVARHRFPKSRSQMLWTLLKHLLGGYAFSEFKVATQQLVLGIPPALQAMRVVSYLGFCAAAIHFDFWLETILYWMIPFATVLPTVLYVRLVGEHGALPEGDSAFSRTRHVDPAWWERVLISPNRVNYHLDHHLYPQVPFYHLPQLHVRLMKDEAYRRGACITEGYVGGLLLKECIHRPERHAIARDWTV